MHPALTARSHRAAVALTAVVLSLAAAAPAAAQPKPVVVTAKTIDGARARATWLVARAEAYDVGEGQEGRYFDIAQLYRSAAELRGVDTAAIANYRMAAWSYSAGGDNTAALRMMTRAAQLAAEVDHVERAIGSYLDAALLAKAAGRNNQLAPLMREVDLLLESPLLPADRRIALLQRIEAEPALAELAAAF